MHWCLQIFGFCKILMKSLTLSQSIFSNISTIWEMTFSNSYSSIWFLLLFLRLDVDVWSNPMNMQIDSVTLKMDKFCNFCSIGNNLSHVSSKQFWNHISLSLKTCMDFIFFKNTKEQKLWQSGVSNWIMSKMKFIRCFYQFHPLSSLTGFHAYLLRNWLKQICGLLLSQLVWLDV